MSATRALPAGYVRLPAAAADVVCRADAADAVAAVLGAHGTLYAWGAAHPARRELRGRASAWAVPLPGAGDVVVRHSWHGGLLAPVTRDLFLAPTRAPGELTTSERLRGAGVRTPQVVAYAVYPAPLGLRRADVVTRLVPGGRDLAEVLRATPADREAVNPWVRATGALLHAMARAGARHPDLNLKNVLLTPAALGPDDAHDAWVLDVDVVRVDPGPEEPGRTWRTAEANWERLARSLRKWRTHRALAVSDLELEALRVLGRRGADAAVEVVWRPGPHGLTE